MIPQYRLIDFYEHALGVKLDKDTKAEFENGFLDARRKQDNALNSIVGVARNLPQEIAKAIQAAHGGGKGDRRERAKGVTDSWIAREFNQYAQPLVKKVYRIEKEGDEGYIRAYIIPKLKDRHFAMKSAFGGLCIYEPQRGGDKSGYVTVGHITTGGIKKWLTNYPDESKTEPISGFHAGMLTSKKEIEEAAKRWGEYYLKYALDFVEWRKTHQKTPRTQYRPPNPTIIHGAEKM